jgi:CRISPR-associated endoribonuclease Cas6
MRIITKFENVVDELIAIKNDIGKYILHLCKTIFSRTAAYENIYSNNSQRTFVNALLSKRKIENDKMILENSFHFHFSSSNKELCALFIDGVNSLMDEDLNISFHNSKVKIKKVIATYNSKVFQNSAAFKTVSPVLIPLTEETTKGYIRKGYVRPDEPGFSAAFSECTSSRYNKTTRLKVSNPIGVSFLKCKKVAIPFYGGLVFGFVGEFEIFAEPEVLNFVIENGLGVKTGAGFGMIKLKN